MGHAENEIGIFDQLWRQHAATLAGDVHPKLLDGADGMGARRLAFHRAEPG
jgi:hypothetical protein